MEGWPGGSGAPGSPLELSWGGEVFLEDEMALLPIERERLRAIWRYGGKHPIIRSSRWKRAATRSPAKPRNRKRHRVFGRS